MACGLFLHHSRLSHAVTHSCVGGLFPLEMPPWAVHYPPASCQRVQLRQSLLNFEEQKNVRFRGKQQYGISVTKSWRTTGQTVPDAGPGLSPANINASPLTHSLSRSFICAMDKLQQRSTDILIAVLARCWFMVGGEHAVSLSFIHYS